MDIYFGHLDDANGIGQDRFGLSVFVAGGINFELWWLGPFGIVILEEADKEFDGLFAFELDGRSYDAGGVAIEYEGLQVDQFRSQRVDRCVWAVLEEDGTFL